MSDLWDPVPPVGSAVRCPICAHEYVLVGIEAFEPGDEDSRRPTNCPRCDFPQKIWGYAESPARLLRCLRGQPLSSLARLDRVCEFAARASAHSSEGLRSLMSNLRTKVEAHDDEGWLAENERARHMDWLQSRVQAMRAFEQAHYLEIASRRAPDDSP